MAGNPDQANIFDAADVYVSFDLDAANPATIDDDFPAEWALVGLLDGEDGFKDSRDEDVTDHFSWGSQHVRTSRKNFKYTRTFTALETNDTTYRLRWPGSTDSQIVVPRIERVKVAFEVRDSVTDEIRRLITHYQAECVVDGDVEENDSDIAGVSFAVTVYPDDDLILFDRQDNTFVAS